MNLPPKSVLSVANSLVSRLATNPMLVLIVLIILLALASGISAKITRDRMLKKMEVEIRMEKKALEERERELRKDYERSLKSIRAERDRLKGRLGELEGLREDLKPPESVNELISRFRALGY